MIVDVNVSLSRWPFRRLAGDETHRLIAKLRDSRVTQAWAGSFDAILHRDLAAVNDRLAEGCRQSEGYLLPFGTVNPMLPDWQEDLRRCHAEHRMAGIRVFPAYHQFDLDSPVFLELAQRTADAGMILQIVVSMEDVRTQHPLVQVEPVNVRPLTKVLPAMPGLSVVLLNALGAIDLPLCQELVAAGNVHFDIAMLEGIGGLERMLAGLPMERLLFGSHFPFFNHEAASLKVAESSLATPQLECLLFKNAQRLLRKEA